MRPFPLRRALAALALLCAAGCERKLTGPAPELSAVAPQAVCGEQLTTEVVLSGQSLSPLVSDGLTDTSLLNLPRLTLVQAQSISGGAGSGAQVAVPDDAADPASSRVRWTDGGKMRFEVFPELGLEPGLYTLSAENRNGQTAQLAEALLVVPRPTLTEVRPDLVCSDKGNTVTLVGDFFIRSASARPSIAFDSQRFTPEDMTDCRPLPGKAGLEACRSLTVVLPSKSLEPRTHAVKVTNPATVACASTESVPFTLVPEPTLQKVDTDLVCATQGGTNLTLTGTGFLVVDGATPTLTLGTRALPTTASDCTTVSGPKATVSTCTTLSAALPPDALAAGEYEVRVTNPAPADCFTSQPVKFTVVAPPTLASVVPSKVCAQGGSVDLVGTNFVPGMVVRLKSPTPSVATEVVLTDATRARATFSGPLPVGGPYEVEVVTAAGGCEARLAASLSVTASPVVFFVDPPVVYNGITTQATLYASGFSQDGLKVQVRRGGTTDAFVDVPAQYNPAEANRIVFTLEQGLAAGSYDVRVMDAGTLDCPGALAEAFRVVDQTSLVVEGIQPPFGYTGDDTAVELTLKTSTDPNTGAVVGGFQGLPRLYLNPATAGAVAVPLEAVAVGSASKASAVVPRGQQVGVYDVIVINPDGAVGVLDDAFRILAEPLPLIDEVSPGSLVTGQAAAPFKVVGRAFRAPAVGFRCQDAITGALTELAATVTATTCDAASGACTTDATVNTSNFADGQACVVRLTNSDASHAEYSSVVFTNPAQKLTAFKAGPALTVKRRAPVALAGFVTRTAQFLYALGGDDGAAAGASSSVESAPLDLFGNPGAYFAQPNALTVARTRATGQRVGRFLYVAGGHDGTGPLSSVERAYLLNPADRVKVTDLDLTFADQGLGSGVYFYRVAAVMGASDAYNPGGENLPSDPFPVSLPALEGKRLVTTLRWAPVTGAASYRVYRTEANAQAGTEKLLAEVTGATQFADDGSLTPAGASPLPIGSTGRWHKVGDLTVARDGAASAVATDPSNPAVKYLYVLGGKDGAGALLGSYDILPLTLEAREAQAVGTLSAGVSTFTPRWQLGAYAANSVSAPVLASGRQFLYVVGGRVAGGGGAEAASGGTQAAEVGANGVLGVWSTEDTMTPARAGFGYAVANSFLFAFGGGNSAPSANTSAARVSATTPPDLESWSSTSAQMLVSRYLMGSTQHGAFVYLVGGQSGTGAEQTTEQIIW